jgi:hypothetical protein
MLSRVRRTRKRSGRIGRTVTRLSLMMALAFAGSLLCNHEASAGNPAVVVAAAQTADGGIGACSNNTGKALYDCVANVLDKLSNDISNVNVPATRNALQTAASKLRAAVNKAQALSAITQCRALISGALAKVRALGGGYVEGWGGGSGQGTGLAAIVGVLSHAAKLIQTKG